jgi:hypothetical protein
VTVESDSHTASFAEKVNFFATLAVAHLGTAIKGLRHLHLLRRSIRSGFALGYSTAHYAAS